MRATIAGANQATAPARPTSSTLSCGAMLPLGPSVARRSHRIRPKHPATSVRRHKGLTVEIKENTGLPMAVASVGEAVDTDWSRYRGKVEIVRVVDPPADTWPDLLAAGFLPKPSWLTWIAATGPSEQAFTAELHRKERQSITAARRYLDDTGSRIEVGPLDETFLDRFLKLYTRQLARMRHAMPVAVQQRGELLAAATEFFVVGGWQDDTLVGGCVSQYVPGGDLVRIRFSAVDTHGRRGSLARLLYMAAVNQARGQGYRQVSLGNDPNLYGHVVEPGLFAFKTRLGFHAVPSQTVRPYRGDDSADLILGQSILADPALLLAYPPSIDSDAGTELRLEVFAGNGTVEAERYARAFRGESRIHSMASWPRTHR